METTNAAPKKRMLSCIQPSGIPTLGNYLGALKNWKTLADDFDGAFAVADLHAITVRQVPAELRRRWGDDYDRWAEKIAAAVDATDGEVLTWEGKPIFAAFHACSPGRTEASEDVWVTALPYLRSVPTPETEADVPSFRSEVPFGTEELRSLLEDKIPGAVLPEDPAEWFSGEKRTSSGRLLSVEAGGVTLSGTAFRMLLGLRSTAVTWSLREGTFLFETEGYGHGVGLSQYGAEASTFA